MTNFGIENLFPIPIYHSIVDNIQEIEAEYQSKKDQMIFYDAVRDWGKTHKLTTQTFKDNIIDELEMNVIKKTIHENLCVYCQVLGFEMTDYQMTSWVTSFDKGEYAHVHNHADADISGCYYYKTIGDDGNIFFNSPVQTSTSLCYKGLSSDWFHRPIVGKMLMFPGWLPHGVRTNETDFNRRSLAFNFYFDRKIK